VALSARSIGFHDHVALAWPNINKLLLPVQSVCMYVTGSGEIRRVGRGKDG